MSKKTIDAKFRIMAVCNPELKVVHYDMKNADGTFRYALEKMHEYIKSVAKSRDEETRLYAKNQPILSFPRLTGLFLEKFGGYKRI